jgi:V/A-type H+-transporting ATPase subunit I
MIQVFADVLSYLRLYALALAGMIMATTFNDMGMTVGLLGGFIVILAGHAVNILLGIMAGVIHGLRLNFIEWYHFSFDGGGRLFKPLKLLKSEEE